MTRTLLTAALFSLLAAGCGRAALDARASSPAAEEAKIAAHEASPEAEEAAAAEAGPESDEEALEAAAPRQPGDYVAYRFTGSFQKRPITLTQRIVAREGSALVVDVTVAQGERSETLRVRMSDDPERRGEILAVARIDAQGAEQAAPLAAYEELMARTTLAADANEAELGTEAVQVEVGGQPLACNRTSYRVRIGGKGATMRTIQSAQFAWGDLGGEITAEDGSVLYRAEVIEAGRAGAQPAVAASGLED
jgi:hypothetical protein